jgi:hypothetical protein
MRGHLWLLGGLVACGSGATGAPGPDGEAGDSTIFESGTPLPEGSGSADGASSSGEVEAGLSSQDGGPADVVAVAIGGDGDNDAGVAWNPSRYVCGIPPSTMQCSGLDGVTFGSPLLVGADGGALPPGWSATLKVVFTNTTSQSFDYPCVGFAADDSRVTFSASPANPSQSAYVIQPGASVTFSTLVNFASTLPAGTVVRFAAWADQLNYGCTNGAEFQWTMAVN